MSQSQFTDFDQKIVTGTQVVSALTFFSGQTIAVLIETKAFRDGQNVAATHSAPMVTRSPTRVALINVTAFTVAGTYINYNAQLAINAAGGVGSPTGFGAPKQIFAVSPAIHFSGGFYTAISGFVHTAAVIHFNGVTIGVNTTGNAEFISPSTRFRAHLIKDVSGTIIGVAFSQI